MPKKAPPIWPKGTRPPNSGRVRGTPNKVSAEARALVSQLVNNPTYQRRLRRDFELRKVHPTIESLVWQFHLGRPRQDITLDATVNVSARYDEERRAFLQLDVADIEQLANESQRLVDRAIELAKTRSRAATPPPAVIESGPKSESPKASGAAAGCQRPLPGPVDRAAAMEMETTPPPSPPPPCRR
jgi:hypothetical protein